MNWVSLKKEQKQMIVLIGMVLLGSVVLLYIYVIGPFLKSGGQVSVELDTIRTQLKQSDEVMRSEKKVRTDYAVATSNLHTALERYVTPVESPLSWATEKIYRQARLVGVDVESVNEATASTGGKTSQPNKNFVSYGVRLFTRCGYADLLKLIHALEDDNPYLCLTEIGITPQDRNVQQHQVSITVEWPMRVLATPAPPAEKSRKPETPKT